MLRQKPQTLFTLNEVTGVSGSTIFTLGTFDFNTIVAKWYATAFSGTTPTLDIYVQNSDDGGVTFYDLIHFTQGTTTYTLANAWFADIRTGGTTGYVGQPKSSNIAAGTVSGLPIVGNTFRVVYTYGGTIGTANVTLQLTATDQDYR